MSISLAEAQSMLESYRQAELDALSGKITEWAGRRIEDNGLQFIRDGRREWEQKVTKLERAAAGHDGSRGFAATANFDE